MQRSETIGKLALALSKAQGAIEAAEKAKINPQFHSKYADLQSVWDAIRKPLSENELAVVQTLGNADADYTLTTMLVHSSGEWISGEVRGRAVVPTPQGLGSLVTYLRRYSLQAIVGNASGELDDDANAGSSTQPAAKKPEPAGKAAVGAPKPAPLKQAAAVADAAVAPPQPPPAPTPAPKPPAKATADGAPEEWVTDEVSGNEIRLFVPVRVYGKDHLTAGVTEDTLKSLLTAAKALGQTDAKKILAKSFNVGSSLHLSETQAKAALAKINLELDLRADKGAEE